MGSELSPHDPARPFFERAIAALAVAFAFLTVLPVRSLTRNATDDDVKAARFAFPIVGIALGVAAALLSQVFARASITDQIAAFLLIALLAAVTGALHLDGLGDTADGLFLWGDAPRRLTVMRDPQVGSYALVMVVLTLLGKYAALSSLAGGHRAWALLGALAASRTAILVTAGRSTYARPEGTGRLVVEATTSHETLAAAALVLLAGTLCGRVAGLVASAIVLSIALGLAELAKRRIGGVTGDVLGALVELGETAHLLTISCLGQ